MCVYVYVYVYVCLDQLVLVLRQLGFKFRVHGLGHLCANLQYGSTWVVGVLFLPQPLRQRQYFPYVQACNARSVS